MDDRVTIRGKTYSGFPDAGSCVGAIFVLAVVRIWIWICACLGKFHERVEWFLAPGRGGARFRKRPLRQA